MTKHTPGPWVLEVDEDEGIIRLRMGTALDEDAFAWDAPHLIELEFDPTAEKTWEEAVANMCLMSASIDLLEAAEKALEVLRIAKSKIVASDLLTFIHKDSRIEEAYAKLSDAIAKARGDSFKEV